MDMDDGDKDKLAGYQDRLNQLKSIKGTGTKDPGILASAKNVPAKTVAAPPKIQKEGEVVKAGSAQAEDDAVSSNQGAQATTQYPPEEGEEDSSGEEEPEAKEETAQNEALSEEDEPSQPDSEEENDEQVERTLDDLVTQKRQEKADLSAGIPRINTYSKISQPAPGVFAYRNKQGYHGLNGGSGINKVHLIILSLLGIVVIGATVYLLKSGYFFAQEEAPSPTPQATLAPTPTPQPTPVPVPDIDRSKFKIRVLNGTGKPGFAASTSAKLKGLGFQTEKAANATNSAFIQTVVRTKASAQGLEAQLIKDLAPDFSATTSGNLKETDAVDGEVILGQK